ncbi:helix-turn-helix transcriptional regulator [bacterium]|nr:helix-turn-helix transcriptional regulator [bacterium]
MYMNYKIDVLDELKNRGYNTTVLRKRKILAEGVIQSLRHQKPISWANIEKICLYLNCQPGDILCSGDNWDGSQLLSKPIVIVLPKKKRKALL